MAIEPHYTVDEAAEIVRVSPWTLWAKLRDGELTRTKFFGRTLIKESELQKLLKDERNQ